MTWLRRILCALGGHDVELLFESARLSMICVSCGFKSPGWDLRVTRVRRVTQRLADRRGR